MRKSVLSVLAAFLLFSACQKNTSSNKEIIDDEIATIDHRSCASFDVLQEQIANDPSVAERINRIEEFTKRVITNKNFRTTSTSFTIPVVVHVLYKTNAEKISLDQVNSQIEVLNRDYNLQNSDANKVPDQFSSLKANVGVNFMLQDVIYKPTNKKSWQANDAMKKSSQGGSDAVNPEHVLNIWVCNLGQGLLGYAQFPGLAPATDGVVILYSAFGDRGTLIQNYNKGRTATHEVGHWMNLRHIWGDASCGNDFVGDTPLHNTANYGCPSYPHLSTCSGNPVEMTMNYMDYTDDACMYMFTNGQKERMQAIFSAGGPRASFIQ